MFELQSSNLTQAAEHFVEALALEPELEPALVGLAEAFERQGQTSRAADLRRKARSLARLRGASGAA